jgi:hypothetical protein
MLVSGELSSEELLYDRLRLRHPVILPDRVSACVIH